MRVCVLTAVQAAERDRAAIDAGTPSVELMRRAGQRAARTVLERLPSECARGVCVFTGPGNNGGDGWIVASELQQSGVAVWVDAVSPPATSDARWAATTLIPVPRAAGKSPGVVIDALLGTGAHGPARAAVADAMDRVAAMRHAGAKVVSLDLPSGLNATTGEATKTVRADLTLSFGHLKRGQLARRDLCGELMVLDIGLLADQSHDPMLVDAQHVREAVPPIAASAHKGTRKRVLIVGGFQGMAGASMIAAAGAFRSGVGMVRFCAQPESIVALQCGCPQATALPWPDSAVAWDAIDLAWPHAVLIGPGVGTDPAAGERVTTWLSRWRGPVVVDADVFTVFAGAPQALGDLLQGRPAVATPHAAEAARLLGGSAAGVAADPYSSAALLASRIGAAVLLKGVPTVVATPDGGVWVVPRGTPALATGGSGDLLSGIVVTLLAQMTDAAQAAVCGAWVHGRAAELAGAGRPIRGVTLTDIMQALAGVWNAEEPALGPGVLAYLPAVGEAPRA